MFTIDRNFKGIEIKDAICKIEKITVDSDNNVYALTLFFVKDQELPFDALDVYMKYDKNGGDIFEQVKNYILSK